MMPIMAIIHSIITTAFTTCLLIEMSMNIAVIITVAATSCGSHCKFSGIGVPARDSSPAAIWSASPLIACLRYPHQSIAFKYSNNNSSCIAVHLNILCISF